MELPKIGVVYGEAVQATVENPKQNKYEPASPSVVSISVAHAKWTDRYGQLDRSENRYSDNKLKRVAGTGVGLPNDF